jgi:hypothetical protein
MQTCKLTDRNNLYGFGVALLELLASRKALNLQAIALCPFSLATYNYYDY